MLSERYREDECSMGGALMRTRKVLAKSRVTVFLRVVCGIGSVVMFVGMLAYALADGNAVQSGGVDKPAMTNILALVVSRLRIPSGTSGATAFKGLAETSQSLDPRGVGVRIVYQGIAEPWDDVVVGPDTLASNMSLLSALELVAGITGCEIHVIEDIVLCFRRQSSGRPHFQTGVLRGELIDSLTGKAVTNASFVTCPDSSLSVTNYVQFDEEGTFLAAVTYAISRPYLDGIVLHEIGDDVVPLRIEAPGYRSTNVAVDFGDALAPPYAMIRLMPRR